jgi:hypothetical protein
VTAAALPGRTAAIAYGLAGRLLGALTGLLVEEEEPLRADEAVAGRTWVGARQTVTLRSAVCAPMPPSGVSLDCRHDTFICARYHCAYRRHRELGVSSVRC